MGGKWRIRSKLNNLQSDDQHRTWSKVLVCRSERQKFAEGWTNLHSRF